MTLKKITLLIKMIVLPNRRIVKDDKYYLSLLDKEYEDFPWLNETLKKDFYLSWIKTEKENDMVRWKREVQGYIDKCLYEAYIEHQDELDNCLKNIYHEDKNTAMFYLYKYMMEKQPDTFKKDGGHYYIIQPT